MKLVENYCLGNLTLNIKQEQKMLHNMHKFIGTKSSTNSGLIGEWYVENILKENKIEYVKQPKIIYNNLAKSRYFQPDFYLPRKRLFIEVKSRTYNCGGTSSEKIDHVARKYNTKLARTKEYKNAKVLIIFCAGELLQDTTKELLNHKKKTTHKYVSDYVSLIKKYNILDLITVDQIYKYII